MALSDSLVKLYKRGRILSASYEAIKFQKLDVFTIMLRQIGQHIAHSQAKDAIETLVALAPAISPVEAGKTSYEDIVKLWNKLHPHNMTTIIASPKAAERLLAIPEFKDAAAGLNFHATGKLITPLGAELIKSQYAPDDRIIAIDKSCALEMVQAGEVTTEHDKLIDRQLERVAITATAGFSPMTLGACAALRL